jgi:hypothetical protein
MKDSVEVFIQISISPLDYCPNPPAVRLEKTADRGTRPKRVRSITFAVSEMRVLVASTGQLTRLLETRAPKKPNGATNVKA